MNEPLRALVVDDSALYRRFVSSVLKEISGVEVVGTASNGKFALAKIESLKPDLITLDMEMPVLDGLGLLREINDRDVNCATIMISALTVEGAKVTNAALQLGAFDFVLKPVGKGPNESREQLQADLTPKIHAYLEKLRRKPLRTAKPVTEPGFSDDAPHHLSHPAEIVCIGVSTGGPAALNKVLPQLPADFPCPVLVVQHMPPIFTKSLAEDLNKICSLEVMEASDGMVAKPGRILIAPGGTQMRVTKIEDMAVVQITDDPPERSCKPAVDYLFRSVASHFGGRTIATVMTGMGDDGTLGCRLLKRKGATILAQNEESCVVYGMPRSVAEAGIVDRILPLKKIASGIIEEVCLGASK